jgi:nicotinamidase-related amidase
MAAPTTTTGAHHAAHNAHSSSSTCKTTTLPNGKYPLWNTEAVLDNCVAAIERAHALGMPVILVQHVADSSKGIAPSSMRQRGRGHSPAHSGRCAAGTGGGETGGRQLS